MIRRRLVTTPHGVSHQPRGRAQAAHCPVAIKMEGASSTRLVLWFYTRIKAQLIIGEKEWIKL